VSVFIEGVPFAPGEFKCVICGAGFKKDQTLVWHRMRKHKTTRRQKGGGRLLSLPEGADGAAGPGCSGGGLGGGDSSRLLEASPPPHLPPPPLNVADGFGHYESVGDPAVDAGDPPLPPASPGAAGEGMLGCHTPVDAEAPPRRHPSASSGFDVLEDAVQDAVDAMDAVILLTQRAKKAVGRAPKRRKAADGDAE